MCRQQGERSGRATTQDGGAVGDDAEGDEGGSKVRSLITYAYGLWLRTPSGRMPCVRRRGCHAQMSTFYLRRTCRRAVGFIPPLRATPLCSQHCFYAGRHARSAGLQRRGSCQGLRRCGAGDPYAVRRFCLFSPLLSGTPATFNNPWSCAWCPSPMPGRLPGRPLL